MSRPITRRSALIALSGLALAACGSGSSGVQSPPASSAATPITGGTVAANANPTTQTLEKVKVGYVPVLPWAPYFVGVERGYFREEGLQIELQSMSGGAEILTQTAAGNFDVGSGGSSAFFNVMGRAKSLGQKPPVRVVAPLHLERPPLATPLVTGKKAFDEGKITRVADLRGKKVAINATGTATEYWLELALRTAGMSVKDVEVVGIPFPNIAQALDAGAIAGAVLTEPFTTLGVRQGQVKVLNDAYLDGDLATIVFYNTEWAAKHPRLAQGFMTGYLRAVRDLESGGWADTATLELISKYTNVPVDVIRSASRPYSDPNGAVNVPSLANQQTFFRQQGRLTYDQDLDIASLVDVAYAQEAAKKLTR